LTSTDEGKIGVTSVTSTDFETHPARITALETAELDLSSIYQDIIPSTTDTYDIGTETKRWNTIWANSVQANSAYIDTLTTPLIVATSGNVDIQGNLSVSGDVYTQNGILDFQRIEANLLPSVTDTYSVGTQTNVWKSIYAGKTYTDTIKPLSGANVIVDGDLLISGVLLDIDGNSILPDPDYGNVKADIIPLYDDSNTLGVSDRRWSTLWTRSISGGDDGIFIEGNILISGNLLNPDGSIYNGIDLTNVQTDIIPGQSNIFSIGTGTEPWNHIWATRIHGNIDAQYIDGLFRRDVLPDISNTYTLGTSSNVWANVWATTLHGNLDASYIDGAFHMDIVPVVSNTYSIGTSSKRWGDVWASNVYVASTTMSGDLIPSANASGNIGNEDARWESVWADTVYANIDANGLYGTIDATIEFETAVQAPSLWLGDGTREEPSLSFIDDTSSGIYRNAVDDTVRITLQGSDVTTFGSNLFHVHSDMVVDGNIVSQTLVNSLGTSTEPWKAVYANTIYVQDLLSVSGDLVDANGVPLLLDFSNIGTDLIAQASTQTIGTQTQRWANLYAEVIHADAFIGDGSGISNLNASNVASGIIDQAYLPVASVEQQGIVQLSNSTSDSSISKASTAWSVKTVQDDVNTRAYKSIEIITGPGLAGGGTLENDVIIGHADTSSQSNIYHADGNVVRDVYVDQFGHIVDVSTFDMDTRYYTKVESDQRFVNIDGDTMTGNLTVPNIRVTGNMTVDGNVRVFGNTTTLNTDTIVSDQLFVINDSTGPALVVEQIGEHDLVEIIDDGNVVAKWFDGGTLVLANSVTNMLNTYTPTTEAVLEVFGNVDVHGTVHGTFSGSGEEVTNLNASSVTVGVVPIPRLPYATTSTRGIVRLDDTVTSTSTDTAPTANVVKRTHDNVELRAYKSTSILPGDGLVGGGTLEDTRVLEHAPTTSAQSVTQAGANVIQNISIDKNGHITSIDSVDLDGRYYTTGEADERFVNTSGDTIAGSLSIQESLGVANEVHAYGTTHTFGPNSDIGLSVNTDTGNGRISFNHTDTVPNISGSSYSIDTSPASSTASITFNIKDNVTSGVPTMLETMLTLTTQGVYTPGDIYSVGDVVAASFHGDGSNVKHIDANNITTGIVAEDRLPISSTLSPGIVQLNDTVTSTSATEAATARVANVINNNANSRALASTQILAGDGLIGGGDLTTDRVISHADTSSQANVINENGVVIQNMSFDQFGHVVDVGSVDLDTRYFTETESDARYLHETGGTMSGPLVVTSISGDGSGLEFLNASNISSGTVSIDRLPPTSTTSPGIVQLNDTVTSTSITEAATARVANVINNNANSRALASTQILAGDGLIGGGDLTTDRVISHADTSSQANVINENGVVVQNLSFDQFGHTVGVETIDLDTRYNTKTQADSRYVYVSGDTMTGTLSFGTTLRQMINLYGTEYGLGYQENTQYYRSASHFAWYVGGTHSDTALDPGTGGSMAMVLDSSGRLGIGGVTAPTHSLHVQGDAFVSGSVYIGSVTNGLTAVTGTYGTVQTTGGTGGWSGYSIDGKYGFFSPDSSTCGIFNDLDDQWMIDCSRNGGVRLYYDGSAKLETQTYGILVSGEVRVTSNVIGFASDRRLKKDIRVLENALDMIRRLKGYRFTWREDIDGLEMRGPDIGLLAQEFQELGLHECLAPAPFDHDSSGKSVSGESYLTIQYNKIHAITIQAMHEMVHAMDDRRNRLDDYERRIIEQDTVIKKLLERLETIEHKSA